MQACSFFTRPRSTAHCSSALFAAWLLSLLVACDTSEGPADVDAAATPRDGGDAQTVGSAPDAARSMLDAAVQRDLDAGHDGLDASTQPVSADAALVPCKLASDCASVRTSLLTLEGCCTDALGCGYDYSSTSGIDRASFNVAVGAAPDARCVPAENLFRSTPTAEPKRVAAPDGGQVLISTDCPTVYFTSTPFRGCCQTNNQCGVSTYPVTMELKELLDGRSYPFTEIECVTTEVLNAQLRASPLAGAALLPSTSGSCDYAALDKSLPALDP